MVTKWIATILFATIMILSCKDDTERKEGSHHSSREQLRMDNPLTSVDSSFQNCDSVFIATSPGTACCMSGPALAKPGEIVTYHYQINHQDPQMSWEIREGDIIIIKGQDSPTVTVRFGPTFTGGVVGCVGSGIKEGVRLECSDRCVVNSAL
jgi:hypothetical protein